MANDNKGKGVEPGAQVGTGDNFVSNTPSLDGTPTSLADAKALASADGKRKPKLVRCVIVHGGLLRDGVVEPAGAEFEEPEASALELERDGVVQILKR